MTIVADSGTGGRAGYARGDALYRDPGVAMSRYACGRSSLYSARKASNAPLLARAGPHHWTGHLPLERPMHPFVCADAEQLQLPVALRTAGGA